jgi:hypothetical protein
MSASSDQWYVQTDIGATLGPMPEDVLTQMARTGALLRRDQVRRGTQSSWMAASDVPGLFDVIDAAEASPESPAAVVPEENVPSRAELKSGAAKPVFAVRAKSASTASTSNVVKPMPPAAEPLSIPTVASVPNIQIKPATAAASPTLGSVSSSRTESEERPEATAAASPTLGSVSSDVKAHEQSQLSESNFTPDAAIRRPPFVPPKRWDRSRQKTDRSSWGERLKRMAFSPWSIVTLVLVGGSVLWWVWPRQRPDIFASYLAIYQELQQQRGTSSDSANWEDFVARSRKQLDQTLPWLEQHAVSGDREKSLLLYLGRDLNELLSRPRDTENPHQQRLDVFVEQLRAMYDEKG